MKTLRGENLYSLHICFLSKSKNIASIMCSFELVLNSMNLKVFLAKCGKVNVTASKGAEKA